jgi:hypothetical protein
MASDIPDHKADAVVAATRAYTQGANSGRPLEPLEAALLGAISALIGVRIGRADGESAELRSDMIPKTTR